MADYAFRSYEERQKIQEMVEAGLSAKEIATSLGISPSAVYAELRRGRDGTRLPDKRLGYNAELAQLSVQRKKWSAVCGQKHLCLFGRSFLKSSSRQKTSLILRARMTMRRTEPWR